MSQYKGFTTVQLKKAKRSLFDLSHENRLSTRMGRLTPIFFTEVLPNDTFRVNSEVMLRLAPLLAPIMHRVNVFVHFFYVPNRLLWKDWEAFITGGRLGTETPPVPPNARITAVTDLATGYLDVGSNADYLGLGAIPDAGAGAYSTATFDLMPHAGFYKIWYDYYRDRNFVADNTILPLPSGTTSSAPTLTALVQRYYRSWQHDYFTSALPWTQRGNEVLMPLVGTGSVTYLENSALVDTAGDPYPAAGAENLESDAGDLRAATTNQALALHNIDEVLLTSSEVSINDFRTANALQVWLERQALGGSRMNETIMAHYNRKTSDARLQRAEYLGGGKVSVKISEVVTTAFSQDADDNTVPPGNMQGHGLTFGNTNRFTYNCEEWGFIYGIMSVMPTSAYMEGSHKAFFGRNTFLDYPWPTFANLGEQEVKDYEIYQSATNTPVDRTAQPTFGYQSRYAEWKQIPSQSHGDFKTSLDFWHMTRLFENTPVLGADFNTFEDQLQDRIFAVSGVDTLWCYIYNQCTVVRSLPYFGTPRLVV